MRIGLVIYGSLDTVSGGYLYDRHLVRVLRARGHTVQVVSLPWESYPRRLWHNVLPSVRQRLATAAVDLWLQDELNHPSLFWLNAQLRKVVAAPVVSIVHHLRSDERHPAWLLPVYRAVERRYLRSVDGFLCNSRTTCARVAWLLGRPPRRKWVAYPAADRFAPRGVLPVAEETVLARAQQPGPLRVLFVGNLIRRKGLPTLLKALARVSPETAVLDVVGREDVEPAYARQMHALADRLGLAQRVRFHGYQDDDGLASLLRQAHVLAVPSEYEGFGIVYLEGMAFGLPALAGNRGAAHEIITPGENGDLLPPHDPAPWAAALARLHLDRGLLARMGLAAQARFRRHPTWDESLGAAEAWLRQWVAPSSSPSSSPALR